MSYTLIDFPVEETFETVCIMCEQEVSPDEDESICFLNLGERQIIGTAAVISDFTEEERAATLSIVSAQAKEHEGLDRLAAFIFFDGRVLWAIDDVSHVTLLLPCEY